MTNTRIDHTNCSHPRTPAGRRSCRDSRKGLSIMGISSPGTSTLPPARATPRMMNLTDTPARTVMAATPAVAPKVRKQPKGRKVAYISDARFNHCVQVELHTPGTIKCACGFSAIGR